MMYHAEYLITAAKVIPMNGRPDCRALAISGGRIIGMGTTAELQAVTGPGTRVFDFAGATITPGLIDAHLHTVSFGMSLDQVDLRPRVTGDIGTLIQRVKARAATTPPGGWVLGRGYDQNYLAERRHPTRQDLDQASRDHPVLITQNSGHMSVANSLALRLAGIGPGTPSPDGGAIVRDEHGDATGLLQETAQALIRKAISAPDRSAVRNALKLAHRQFALDGLTGVHEAGCPAAHPDELALYQETLDAGELHARTYLMIYPRALDTLGMTLGLGLRTGLGREGMLAIGPLKLMADGSLIGLTAAMEEPFSVPTAMAGHETGLWVTDPEELARRCNQGHARGWQLATHAIGDRAIRVTLDCYAEADRLAPRTDARHRIEHCGVLTPELIGRLRSTGTIPVTQPRFISELGDGFRRALGEERLALTYPLRSLFQAGIRVAAGSDRPVVDGAPLLGLHDAVNEQTSSGQPYVPSEAVSFRQALAMFTVNAAYAAHQETLIGSIGLGMAADLTVIGGDPEGETGRIADLRVLGTMVGGRWTHLA